jgi:hypothetical protein
MLQMRPLQQTVQPILTNLLALAVSVEAIIAAEATLALTG